MCGIAGIVDFAGRPIDPGLLDNACVNLRHRGPDDRGTRVDSLEGLTVGLAATRLAILDLSPAAGQPMTRADGRYAIVFNGLIYNFRDLRDELDGDPFPLTTGSDTEVALAACARWGSDALHRFNGMWALLFFDRRRREGFLARDRFGIKPLLWAHHDDRLLFASEMTALRRLGSWPDDIRPASLAHYIRYGFVAHPHTMYRSAHRLPPAMCLPFDATGVAEPVSYYQIPLRKPSPTGESLNECADRLRHVIAEAVAARRVADVPIGAFLSGGIDSSIIVAHLAEHSTHAVKTFSIGWDEHDAYDETRYARLVADQLGTDHHEIKCRFDDVLAAIPTMLDHLGEPFFDSSILPTALVSHFARRHVTVCLSGDGGDELFGGYWRYLAHQFLAGYESLPLWLRNNLIEPFADRLGASKSSALANRVRQFRKLLRAKGAADPFARHAAWSSILAPEARDVLRDASMPDEFTDRIGSCATCPDDARALDAIMAFDLGYSLPNDMLHKVDLASMYHSLEVRVPLLDHRVVQAASSIPFEMKIAGAKTKLVLKHAYRGILPSEVLRRSKKGFDIPIGEFFRIQLRDLFRDTVTRDTVESFGLIDYDAVDRAFTDHCRRRAEHADLLFALLSLCWWRRSMRSGRS